MHASLRGYTEELLLERGNVPAVLLTNLCRQQAAANQEGQAMLDLLPADSKGSNKETIQSRKQICTSKQHSLGLLMFCRKTGILTCVGFIVVGGWLFFNIKPEKKKINEEL